LSFNQIAKIDAFNQNSSLRSLDFKSNLIKDIRPLSNLSRLYYLDVSHNFELDSLIDFKNMTNLRRLFLSVEPMLLQSRSNIVEQLSTLPQLDLRKFQDKFNYFISVQVVDFDYYDCNLTFYMLDRFIHFNLFYQFQFDLFDSECITEIEWD
jgi:hypothetical protein